MGRKLDKIVMVDVESTCWRGQPPTGQMNEIIEVGICSINIDDLSISDKNSYIVKPTYSIVSDFCTELTGLTQEIVDNGETFANICNKIQNEYGSRSRIWVSYGEYDKNQFKKCCRIFDVEYPFSDMHWNLKAMASIFYGWKEMGMDKLLDKLGIKMDGRHHRGIDDAYNISKILIDILSKGRQ